MTQGPRRPLPIFQSVPSLILAVLSLLSLPLLYIWNGAQVIRARFFAEGHSYWTDPEYAYLLNGQVFLNNRIIFHIDHPGTPVQIFNGLLQWFVWKTDIISASSLLLEDSVIQHAESHQLVIAIILLLLQASVFFLIAFLVAQKFSFLAGLTVQVILLLLCMPLIRHLVANKPEGFVLIFVILSLCILTLMFQHLTAKNSFLIAFFGFSFLLALAITSKISAILVVSLLPLVLVSWQKILVSYVFIGLFSSLILFKVWPMRPTAWAFWTSSSDTFRNLTSLIKAAFFTQLPLSTYIFIFVIFLVVLSMTVNARHQHQTHLSASLPLQPRITVNTNLLVFYLVAIAILIGQPLIATARNALWLIPAIPVAALAGGIALFFLLRVPWPASSYLGRLGWPGSTTLLVLSIAIVPLIGIASPPTMDATLDTIQKKELTWQVKDNLIIYDWSLAWSDLPYGGECAALIFGDGFARQLIAKQLTQKCPNHRMGRFQSDLVISEYGNGPTSCDALGREIESGRGVAIVAPTGAPIPTFLEIRDLAQSRGWRFSEIIQSKCPIP